MSSEATTEASKGEAVAVSLSKSDRRRALIWNMLRTKSASLMRPTSRIMCHIMRTVSIQEAYLKRLEACAKRTDKRPRSVRMRTLSVQAFEDA